MSKPKLVLFDIGGVLIDYSNVFHTASVDQSIPITLIDQTFDKYDSEITTGKITPQELYLKCLEENNLEADKNYDFLASWVNDYQSIQSTFKFIESISSTYSIGLFSNIYKGMVPVMIQKKLLPNINYAHLFLSCDLGIQKPQPEIYAYIQNQARLSPTEILFIDDKPENLKPASSVGWQVFQFDRSKPISF